MYYDEAPSPRTQFMWADDLFAYLDVVELNLSEEAKAASDKQSELMMRASAAAREYAPARVVGAHMMADGLADEASLVDRRAKNRLSAQLSRLRKKQYVSCLEARLGDLVMINRLLDDSVTATDAQNACLLKDIVVIDGLRASQQQPTMQTDDTHTAADGGPIAKKRQCHAPGQAGEGGV